MIKRIRIRMRIEVIRTTLGEAPGDVKRDA